ncbi:hypothetical protein Scep_023931 [Stephania cephalantha]|uniref:Uncharacterized protein n=1 Tax=Stephania cephalantha TaxID=152367 RepID=A0AAP0HXT1_9MAGN
MKVPPFGTPLEVSFNSLHLPEKPSKDWRSISTIPGFNFPASAKAYLSELQAQMEQLQDYTDVQLADLTANNRPIKPR